MMLLTFMGQNCTAAYWTYHRRAFPHDSYVQYRVTPKENKAPEPLPDFTSLKEIADELAPYLAPTKGYAPWWYYIKAVLILLLPMSLEIYMLKHGRTLGLSLLWGIGSAWIGLNVQHDANHGAISANPLINRLFGLGQDYIGGNSLSWSMNHNIHHHVHTNDPERDTDLLIPGLRLHKSFNWLVPHQYQHYYMVFLEAGFGFFHTFWTNWELLSGVPQGKEALTPFYRTSQRIGAAIFLLRLFLPLYFEPTGHTVFCLIAGLNLGGLYLAFFFLLSHNFHGVKFVDSSKGDFAQNQVETSSNVCGPILGFFNGGLNYQIEHHLFPRVHHSHYPTLAKTVRAYAKRKGWAYRHFDSILENFASTLAHLKDLGERPPKQKV